MIRHAIAKVTEKEHLTEAEAMNAMNSIMAGEATPSQIAAFITGLRMKGETVDEITGCAKAMRARAQRIQPKAETLIDTCGTGGDGANTFNISTAAAFVVAGAGVSVAKHGNRSVSSKCGSADVLEALGVTIDLPPKTVEACIDEVGIGFLFAPRFHLSMKHAVKPRQELGIRTIFNVLGPLTNPATAQVQVVGVYDASLTEPLAHVLGRLGVREAYIVHGLDRLDEMTISGKTQISHLKNGSVSTYTVQPEDAGLRQGNKEALVGGNAMENAQIIIGILQGEHGPRRDIVLFNASAALVVAGKASDLSEGVRLASESIDSGAALETLKRLKDFTSEAVA